MASKDMKQNKRPGNTRKNIEQFQSGVSNAGSRETKSERKEQGRQVERETQRGGIADIESPKREARLNPEDEVEVDIQPVTDEEFIEDVEAQEEDVDRR